MDHLTDDVLDELIRDTLGPDQQTAAMHHLDTCSDNRAQLENGSLRILRNLRDHRNAASSRNTT